MAWAAPIFGHACSCSVELGGSAACDSGRSAFDCLRLAIDASRRLERVVARADRPRLNGLATFRRRCDFFSQVRVKRFSRSLPRGRACPPPPRDSFWVDRHEVLAGDHPGSTWLPVGARAGQMANAHALARARAERVGGGQTRTG